ncbi:MAG TPA: FAD-binding oxidoreductase [Longimicrobium sp.]|uniref:NAD(P)/FAD-dependent oxidoreductase n=1 Tax=Longimicrobium sp. TaxID=2029185 RepID=UPI002ED85A9A
MATFHLPNLRIAPAPANVPVWNDAPWTPLPPLADSVKADVCVVGLGGSGLSAVGELLGLGVSVVGIDAGSVAGGAAGRNGGFLLAGTYHFYHDAVSRLGRERAWELYRLTMDEVDRIAAESPEAVRRTGSLRVADDDEERLDCARQLAAMRAHGLPAEAYSGPEGDGLLIPTDCAFQPLRRCRTLARRAADAGARLYEHTPALRIAGNEVRTPGGRIRCGAVLVAVDGGLEQVLPELCGRVRTARLQMLATAPTGEVCVPRPVYARWGFEYWQQLEDGRIALGGFRDGGGAGEWTVESTPGGPVQQRLEAFLRGRIGVQAPITHRWAAPVGYTPDGMPVLEEVRPRVWAAGGYSGTGNVMGALCGRAMAQWAVRGRSELADVIHGHGAESSETAASVP